MEPVYHEGQFIITHIYTDLNRFDCVTIKADNKSIIKRIIGLPGEKIEYKDNKLYINDVETPDPYGVGNTTDFVAYTTDGYFCLGDNRAVSYDSRYYGEFVRDKITSKANWS
jgi:signal peptidase I